MHQKTHRNGDIINEEKEIQNKWKDIQKCSVRRQTWNSTQNKKKCSESSEEENVVNVICGKIIGCNKKLKNVKRPGWDKIIV